MIFTIHLILGALISAGFKVSTTVMGGGDHDSCLKDIPDDESSVAKSNTLPTMDMQSQFNSLRKAYRFLFVK